ncbi:MAG TPA: VWA domain-containing protein [Vicinamibacterales bacterium]|jgi:Ca-activated chloride channel homolog|nr:VWA domain-containing protein [Vicinamibacterales bacterium]
MRRRGLGFGFGIVAVVTAAGLLAAQAPQPAPQTPAPAAQSSAPATQTPAPPPPPTASAPAAASQAPQRPSFRGGVDVVSLNVTVTDQSRNFVTSLEQGDFVVFEDGVKQDVTYFNKAQLPVALSLLIDTSASMEDKLRLAQEAAIGFIRRMKPDDIAQVIDFDNRVSILQQFTSDRPALEAAIRQTVPNGSTSLHNAIYISLKELKKVRATSSGDVRRQAIVVLSDGEDTSSLVPFEEVLDLAKRSEVIVYTIGIRGRDLGARGFPEAEFVLKQFAQETGGRSFFPTGATELEGIYAQIADELAAQYALAYSSRNPRRDGQWRRIVVRTTRPDLAARTKQGYFGPVN